MNHKEANYFISTLSSKHQSLQSVLRRMVNGQNLSEENLKRIADSDSRAGAVVEILQAINTARSSEKHVASEWLTEKLEALDSFGAPLQPLLFALAGGLKE